jgi:hypothetical protein
MSWYKKAQGKGPYSLFEIIMMQEDGLSLASMDKQELEEAKEAEKNGFLKKKVNKDGYLVYVIDEEKFKERGWRIIPPLPKRYRMPQSKWKE